MATLQQNGDLLVTGTLSVGTRFVAPAGNITNAMIAAGSASNYVAASKLEHQFGVSAELVDSTSVINPLTRMMHIVQGLTGELVDVSAVTITPPTSSVSFAIDLRKVTASDTGTSLLSSVLTFASTSVARTAYSGTLSGTTLAAGEQLHLIVTTTGSTANQALGLLATVTLREDPT